MSLTLCLNTSTIQPQPLLDKIRLTAEAGFTAIELWINDIHEYVGRGGEVRDIERALADHGLSLPCMIALRQWGEASPLLEYRLVLDEARRRMELAARLGARYVVATPPRASCDFAQIAARYKELLAIGRGVGVRPTFEYISFFRSTSRLADAWSIVQAAEEEDATLILDAFHSWNSNSTPADLEMIPIDRISHYHINDAPATIPPTQQTDPDRVMLGEGVIKLAAELRVLRDKGYSGAVSLELFNRNLWDRDPREVLRIGYERLRELIDE